MSFGFGSGQQQQSTFGGFGSGSTGGFGQSTTTSGGSLFGGGQTATSGGFGGFGSTQQTSSPFGQQAKPAFGAPAATSGGSSLFGGGTATSGGFGSGGGFGSSTTGTGGFGSSTGGGLFGQQQQPKPTGFGSTSTGGSLFGGGGTTGGFGSSQPQQPSNPFSTQPQGGTGSGFTFGGASTASNNNGTANTPFQAFSEKDTAGGQTSSYQSISFQQPYQTKSFEELRTEDYAQGRRFGNSNGQAGSFGQSTGFGGFGQTSTSGGGLFGGSTTQTSGGPGFGSTGGFGSTSTGGFGSTQQTGGGLFGTQQPKPATGGLFGTQTSATSTGGFGSTSGSGGGLFGGGSTGGFGSGTQSGTTGGGLFGTQNQQQQPKPAFGGFGQTQSTGTGFGSGTSTGGGLFGSTQNQGTGSSLFGQQPQQQQSNPFGGTSSTGGGLFGQQNKPAGGGLFGGSTGTSSTGTGLFGAQNQQQQSNPFGGSTTTGGGLFGNQNQPKPTGTGLFGSSTSGTTGGGLFGGQQNQQTGTSLFGGGQQGTGSSLFGNQNRPAGGSLFGGTQNTSGTGTGLSLFGGNNQNQQNSTGTSLFGGSLGQNNQNQQNQSMNSIFGGSFNQSTPQGNSQNQLHASLTDAPFGNGQLFSSLASPSPPIGPLATPLSGARPAPRKTPSLLASARLNTPVYSPRGSSLGRNGSFGFSYSTYGTPGSAYTSGSLTPGASSLLRPTGSLSSALTSRLNKSLSTSNLRGDATASEGRSLLRPSAFSPDGNAGRYSNGSIRKLNIDRSLRTDLFGMQPKAIETAKDNDAPSLRKRVSFENTGRESTAKPTAENALVRTEEPEEELPSPGLVRAGPSKSKAPEMEQVNGPLSSVPEDAEAPRASSAPGAKAPAEKASKRGEVGDYWTKPAMKDLKNMARAQLKSVGNFIVGREGVGRIEFGPVDLTNTALEDICGNIVQLNPRSATVYQDDQDKPRMGLALNVPSTIYLDNSWPRSHGGKKPINVKSGKDYDKHIARLKRVAGTHFLNYDADTGVWSFKVDHFTTYGLDDDDDESEFADDSRMQEPSSPLSELPETPKGQEDVTLQSMETGSGEPDDTFQFKLDRLPRPTPGGFDDLTHEEPSGIDEVHENEPMMSGGMGDLEDPFLSSGGAVQPPLPGTVERYNSSLMEEDEEPEQDIPGSFVPEPTIPKSILKPSTFLNEFVSPEKLATEAWEDQLQRTMSPKKRDRQALKEMQQVLLRMRDDDVVESPFKKSMLGHSALDQSYLAQRSVKKAKINDKKAELGKSQAFNNAMDIMGSLWTQETKGRKATAGGKDFEV